MVRTISILAACVVFASCALFVGCTGAEPDPWDGVAEPRVTVTFAPLQCFALNVVGDHRQVRGLLSSQGPHHADPPVSQAAMLSKSNLFFANGLGIDSTIADKMTRAVGKNGPKLIRLGDLLPKDMLLEGTACAHCKAEGIEHSHGPDGHVWLGIDQAKAIVMLMAEKLEADYPGKGDWRKNAAKYCLELDQLKANGLNLLKDKKERTILPFHGSMTYFAKTFDLKLMDPIQDVAGQEPTSQRLDELVEKCLKEKVRVIAVEPQYGSQKSATTLLEELKRRGLKDAVIIELDPLETASGEMSNQWYQQRMWKNLETLAKELR